MYSVSNHVLEPHTGVMKEASCVLLQLKQNCCPRTDFRWIGSKYATNRKSSSRWQRSRILWFPVACGWNIWQKKKIVQGGKELQVKRSQEKQQQKLKPNQPTKTKPPPPTHKQKPTLNLNPFQKHWMDSLHPPCFKGPPFALLMCHLSKGQGAKLAMSSLLQVFHLYYNA